MTSMSRRFVMKKLFGGMLIGTLISAACMAFSSYAETKPELKKIKDKIKDEAKHHFDKQKEICKDIIGLFRKEKGIHLC